MSVEDGYFFAPTTREQDGEVAIAIGLAITGKEGAFRALRASTPTATGHADGPNRPTK